MCVDFSSIGMTVEVGPSSVMVSTDGCSQLAAGHSLGPGPFYLFLGSNCSSADCPGVVSLNTHAMVLTWSHLAHRQDGSN